MTLKANKRIRIYGEIVGTIWMPSAECRKDFDMELVRVPREQNIRTAYAHGWPMEIGELRDALLQITNDGDFQSCAIDWAVIEVTRYKANKRITRIWPVKGVGYNSDCFVQPNRKPGRSRKARIAKRAR